MGALVQAMSASSNFRVLDVEDIGPHYATTLTHWRENFLSRRDDVCALGYFDAFVRMWEFYLCYCEAGFAERALGDVQMLLMRDSGGGRRHGH
jgi:cyclopropane-fatty-acyl-phospholipid synthase